MTLFAHARELMNRSIAPLPERMRPQTFDDLVGQEHILGQGKILRSAIDADRLPSIILWGPPGTGKTSLARLIASVTKSHFEALSAVTSGVADLRRLIGESRDRISMYGTKTVLFIDEIHRFNKSQQDVILPHVEDGTVTLVGATTENPSFEVNAPLLSRCRVFTLLALDIQSVEILVRRALVDSERGLGIMKAQVSDEAIQHLLSYSNGDARVALNALEIAVTSSSENEDGSRFIDADAMSEALQHRSANYDKSGDSHYDTISAFIKSIRGSSPDGALYWLARMIDAGEDPTFIARRLVISAAEDVGLADPNALVIATAAQQALHLIGMPEGRIILAEATVYLASAAKSNSAYAGLEKALEDVRNLPSYPVPMHLRNAVTGLMRDLGYGREYRYAHDYAENFVEQTYLPENVSDASYYQPSENGDEHAKAIRLRRLWEENSESR